MRSRSAVTLLAVTVVLAGCHKARTAQILVITPSAAGPPAVALAAPLLSRSSAQVEADALQSAVRLPAKAVSDAVAPNTWLTEPAGRPAITTLVESKRWFTVDASIAEVGTSISEQVPSGLRCTQADMGIYLRAGTAQVAGMTCNVADAPSTRQVQISALPDGTRTDVLVDVQVVWVPPRTPYDSLPAGLTSARLTFSSAVQGVKAAPVTVSGTDLQRLATAINADPVEPPRSMPDSCPPGQGEATLTVSRRVAFEIDVYGCRAVTVLVDGKPENILAYDDKPGALAHALLKLPHYRWP